MMKTPRLLVIVAAAGLLTASVFAADFPSKPVKLIVTAAAGGGEEGDDRGRRAQGGKLWQF